jgi:inorganic phosphate transporter, PiT family
MDVSTLSLVGLVGLALLFDYTNGFHDSANSIATVVATRVLRPHWAVAWAAFFNFVAFMIVGTSVANTVGQTVDGGGVRRAARRDRLELPVLAPRASDLVVARADRRGFRRAQLASSAAVSVEHGGNDARKTMGVIAALLVSTGHLTQTGDKLPIPLWVAVLAAGVIALGTLSGGWRIVRTMGLRITVPASEEVRAAERTSANQPL